MLATAADTLLSAMLATAADTLLSAMLWQPFTVQLHRTASGRYFPSHVQAVSEVYYVFADNVGRGTTVRVVVRIRTGHARTAVRLWAQTLNLYLLENRKTGSGAQLSLY
jgi:hypothetical protein